MRLAKREVALVGCSLAGICWGLDALQSVGSSRVTSHLVGSALIVVTLPLMKWRLARFFQLWTLGWLIGDLVFRNMFGHPSPLRVDAGAWRGVLALAYAAMLVLIALYDRAVRRKQLPSVKTDSA